VETKRMKSGVQITFPETIRIGDEQIYNKARREIDEFPPEFIRLEDIDDTSNLLNNLKKSLAGLGFDLIDQIPIIPEQKSTLISGKRSESFTKIPSKQNIDIRLDVASNEDAILLLEQDGVFSWEFGNTSEKKPPIRTQRSGLNELQLKRIVFSINVNASAQEIKKVQKRGFSSDIIYRPFNVFVLKFVCKAAIGSIVKLMEREVNEGFVNIKHIDPSRWQIVREPGGIVLPGNRCPRILLFIHGTFSCTVGGFGALGITKWGRMFLKNAFLNYDLILGFDHQTLSKDPLENAEDLLIALSKFRSDYPLQIDAICHSRGGLVLRSLIEHLLPSSNVSGRINRAIFVAATNGGTKLAEPDNWKMMIDLYTNIVLGGIRALGIIAPQSKAIAGILSGVLKGLAIFVKSMVQKVISEQQVPGLAAMEPDGDFITEINKVQPLQPKPRHVDYFAITSNFETDLNDFSITSELPRKLKQVLASGFMDNLMKERNDLIVDVPSMVHIDPEIDGYIQDSLDFGTNGIVYHSNYFHQLAVIRALMRWLGLDDLTLVNVSGRPYSEAGGTVTGTIPAEVEQDIAIISGKTTTLTANEIIRRKNPRYVVIQRSVSPRRDPYYYIYKKEEILKKSRSKVDRRLEEAIGLHEYTSSTEIELNEVSLHVASEPPRYEEKRSVVITDGEPIGVLASVKDEAEEELMALVSQLARRARDAKGKPIPFKAKEEIHELIGPHRARQTPKHEVPTGAQHFFRAEMPKEVVLNKVATVAVEISREEIKTIIGKTVAIGSTRVEKSKKIILQVIARKNFQIHGESRAELEPLSRGQSELRMFAAIPTHLGPGELWVIVHQGPVPLVTLKLKPNIVRSIKTGPQRVAVAATSTSEAPTLNKPLNQLTIFEVDNGRESYYQFILNLPGKETSEDRSKPIRGNRNNYITNIYKSIEERWVENESDVEIFLSELRGKGGELFDELIPYKIQKLLWQYHEEIKSIQVLSTEPFIPWELVHIKKPDGKLPSEELFLGQIGMVRWLYNVPWPPEKLIVREGKAFAVIPEYPKGTEYELKETSGEYEFLENRFNAIKIRARENDLMAKLAKPGQFDLLHFAGHGKSSSTDVSDSRLVLEGRKENGYWRPTYLNATTVKQNCEIGNKDDGKPFVVLNACQTGRLGFNLTGLGGFSQAFLNCGAGAFVSTMWAVGDKPARSFTETFYEELLKGKNVSSASISARKMARQAGDATWLAYTVYAHPYARLKYEKQG